MSETIDTVIVGGGQAGLAVSYHLTRLGRPHVVLEQAPQAGEAWRNHRWDSFTLVTPNWMLQLPGMPYAGPDPDGYLSKSEIVAYLEQYAGQFRLPVHYRTRVTAVQQNGHGYLVTTNRNVYEAAHVVMATGSFQSPKTGPAGLALPADIVQTHAGAYRNPQMLPPGAVLVVGSGQSGCQIAEELYQSGRKVYLSIGRTGRVPRCYRGKDITWWLRQIGYFDRPVDRLPSPKAKFDGNPQVSGAHGGHSLNLHQFVRDGVTLVGRLQAANGHHLRLASDVKDNLARIDAFEADLLKSIDGFIENAGVAAPRESVPRLRDGYQAEPVTELDLKAAGVGTVIWASGYAFDYSLVRLPVFDEDGYPVQRRGVTAYPGLYFVGLTWLHMHKSALLWGVGDDAAFVAAAIDGREAG